MEKALTFCLLLRIGAIYSAEVIEAANYTGRPDFSSVHKFTLSGSDFLPIPVDFRTTTDRHPDGENLIRRCCAVLCLSITVCCMAATLDPDLLQQQLIARFGPARVTLLKDWQRVVTSAKSLGEEGKLKHINDFFNQNIGFDDDMNI